ncbi:MAG: cell division site-positioning protein MapZ family protein [Lactococcus sp.]|nr:cell division site-positioning protein MapZ family protein [Lactococcus sp.]
MAKKKKKSTFKEKTIALKDVENLTVEQIAAQSDTLASENKDKESTLDRYIRQHRSEIESAKKDRHAKTVEAANALDQFVRTAREDANTPDTDLSDIENNLDVSEAPASEGSLDGSDASVSEASLDTSDTLVVDSQMDETDTAVTDSNTEAHDGSESAHHVTSESVKATETSQEVAPVFPEIQGSFDTVLLAADDTAVSVGSIDSDTAEEAQTDANQPILDDDTPVDDLKTAEEVAESAVVEPKSDIFSEVSTVPPLIVEDNTGLDSDLAEDQLSEQLEPVVASKTPVVESKKSKKPVIIGICALILLAAGGIVWANINQSKQKEADKTSQSSQKKSEEAKATKAFDQQYAGFFTDDKQTKLKNDQFAKIGELVSAVDKLKNNADYQSLKKKVDALKTEISVTEAMNANFDKAIIVDGALDKTAVVKDGVKLSYTATENDGLNSLLKEAITHGQAQQAEKAKSAAAASAAAPAVTPTTPNTTTNTASQSDGATNQAAGSTNQANTGANQSTAPATNGGAASAGYGLTTAQYQAQYPAITLETGRSRVPVDPNANLNDAAFVWASGIRELVLQKCRDRGYITGDAYILLPASIQKGNGYYNLYKTDGTYLVSINCKTGYFVGNAAGHADNLDY